MTLRTSTTLALLCGFVLSAPAYAAVSAVPTLDPDRLRPGQKAEVRTVFEGEKVESFEAEIVGVLRGGRSEGDMILARATSERVVRTGVAAGMSGSPVYVDGKLIGALSSGWAFSREPIFGITPIGEMLAVLDQQTSRPSESTAGPTGIDAPGLAGGVRFGEFRWDNESTTAEEVPGRAGSPADSRLATGLAPLAIPLAASGLHSRALDVARDAFAGLGLAVVPGGRAPDGGPPPEALVPGAAVAVDVLRGDLLLSAIGTVTYRAGDRILIFGHPLFQSGEVRLPLSTAAITTVIPNQQNSFKLGVTGRQAGVVTQDRRAAVAGTIGGVPRLMPLAVSVASGSGRQQFHFESIEDRALAPVLLGLAAINSLLESGGIGGNQTLRWAMTLHRRGAPPLKFADVVAGETPVGELGAALAGPLRFLFNNPFQRLALDSMSVALEVVPGREQWALRGARVLDSAVRPGGRVRVRCDLERWRGGRETHELSLAVPAEAPDGRYVMWLGGGTELARYEASRLPARYRPISLDDAWRRLAALRRTDALYGALYARAPEVTSEDRDYPELPVSALALLSGGQSAGDRARRGEVAILDETRMALDGVLRGELLLQVNVDSAAP